MTDLREELGRLAGGAGEPGSFRELEVARRRRERHRRAEAFVVVAVIIAAAVVAATTLGGRPAEVPVGTGQVPSDVPFVWPERWSDPDLVTSLDQVESLVAAGDPDVAWRTDPEQVVERFTKQVLGWSAMDIGGQQSGADTQWWQVGPSCPDGGCDPNLTETIRVDRMPDSEVWAVTSVESDGLRTGLETGLRDLPLDRLASTVSDQIVFRFRLPDGRTAHAGLVASNGCGRMSTEDQTPTSGEYALPLPFFAGARGEGCGDTAVGYVFAYATDDTTQPVGDPLREPAAIEAPGLTVIPISVSLPPVTSPSTAPSVSLEPPACAGPAPSEITIVGQGVQLAGCTAWGAHRSISLTLRVQDPGVVMGLQLFPADTCDGQGCAGHPVWESDLLTGVDTKTFQVPPLPAGSYALIDPVHPVTARLEITVG